DVIAAQHAAGIDIGNDGEQARESFFTYVQHRMTGFGDASRRALMRDLTDHPDFMELQLPRFQRMKVNLMAAPAAIANVGYRDTTEVAAECALVAGAPFAETFMTAASPGIVAAAMQNRFYASDAEYVHALGVARSTYPTGQSRGPTGDSTHRPALATSRRPWCGPSCGPWAAVRISGRSACSDQDLGHGGCGERRDLGLYRCEGARDDVRGGGGRA